MFQLLIISSALESSTVLLKEQIKYLEYYKISVTLCIDPTEIDLLTILKCSCFDCAYIHVKRRTFMENENAYDVAKVIEQKRIPLLGSSYITQMFIADKFTTSRKSGMGLTNILISRLAFEQDIFNWEDIKDFPVIVKPNTLHASMGITENSVIFEKAQLKNAIQRLLDDFPFLNEVLIEKYAIDAQEYTVSILGNGDSLACSVSKLQYEENSGLNINSLTQKCLPLSQRSLTFAVEEDPMIRQRLEYHARTLFHHFRMKDIARFDFILNKTYYLLEANTCPMPGNSFSWEWQEKYGLRNEQIIALFLCAFHFAQVSSGKISRFPKALIDVFPKDIISAIDHPTAVDSCPEVSGASSNCTMPHLYSMNDRVSSETEVHTFLKALVVLVKPTYILETGTYKGSSTIAFAEGLRQNNCGHMTTLEIDDLLAQRAHTLLSEYPVEVINQSSLAFTPKEKIDLLFLDSRRILRGEEFEHFRPFLRTGAIIVWHDSSYRERNHSVYDVVEALHDQKIIDRILFPTPRGLTISMLCK